MWAAAESMESMENVLSTTMWDVVALHVIRLQTDFYEA